MVAGHWRAQEGEGTWQQYTLVDEASLVCCDRMRLAHIMQPSSTVSVRLTAGQKLIMQVLWRAGLQVCLSYLHLYKRSNRCYAACRFQCRTM